MATEFTVNLGEKLKDKKYSGALSLALKDDGKISQEESDSIFTKDKAIKDKELKSFKAKQNKEMLSIFTEGYLKVIEKKFEDELTPEGLKQAHAIYIERFEGTKYPKPEMLADILVSHDKVAITMKTQDMKAVAKSIQEAKEVEQKYMEVIKGLKLPAGLAGALSRLNKALKSTAEGLTRPVINGAHHLDPEEIKLRAEKEGYEVSDLEGSIVLSKRRIASDRESFTSGIRGTFETSKEINLNGALKIALRGELKLSPFEDPELLTKNFKAVNSRDKARIKKAGNARDNRLMEVIKARFETEKTTKPEQKEFTYLVLYGAAHELSDNLDGFENIEFQEIYPKNMLTSLKILGLDK